MSAGLAHTTRWRKNSLWCLHPNEDEQYFQQLLQGLRRVLQLRSLQQLAKCCVLQLFNPHLEGARRSQLPLTRHHFLERGGSVPTAMSKSKKSAASRSLCRRKKASADVRFCCQFKTFSVSVFITCRAPFDRPLSCRAYEAKSEGQTANENWVLPGHSPACKTGTKI